MNIEGFIWLESIVTKLWRKHRVNPYEVEALFDSEPYIRFVEKGHREGENVYAAMGQTDAGRYLITFFVLKQNHRAVIISSRSMTDTERRRYEQR